MLGAVLGSVRIDVHPAHGILRESGGRVAAFCGCDRTTTAARMRMIGAWSCVLPAACVLIGHGGILDGGTLIHTVQRTV